MTPSTAAPDVLVLGATGTVGRGVCETLLRMGVRVRGATRDPAGARERGLPASEWVPFDLEDPDVFPSALRGIRRVLLMARPGDPDPARVAAPLLEAMERAGVRRVVNLTAMGAESRGDVMLGAVERMVEAGDFLWTHLRPNWFMQVFATGPLRKSIRATHRLAVPAADAAISFVDARDVAAVAAHVLIHEGHHGTAYTLTGGRAVDHAEVAREVSEAAGYPVEYVPIDEDRARRVMAEGGLGPDRAERLIRFYRLVREGRAAPVTGDVTSVLGRPPVSLTRFARDHSKSWRRCVPTHHESDEEPDS